MNSTSHEVSSAAYKAIGAIRSKGSPKVGFLEVGSGGPFSAVRDAMDRLREFQRDEAKRKEGLRKCAAFLKAMPRLEFRDNVQKGQAWHILGMLIFYLEHPTSTTFDARSPKAAECFRSCLKYQPERAEVREYLKGVS